MAKHEEPIKIKIILVEDHEIICYGLKALLSKQNDLEVIAVASTCEQVLELPLRPHVILLDISPNTENYAKFIPKLSRHFPNAELLIFNASHDNEKQICAMELGASGILYKEQSIDLICKAIRHIHFQQGLWVDNALTTEMWRRHRNQMNATEDNASFSSSFSNTVLTPKEKEVACLSANGLSAKEIGEKLFISEKTVRNKLTVIYSKLNVKGQLELTLNKELFDD